MGGNMKKNNYFDYYEISNGDTLFNIAKNNNVNINLLALLNGLNQTDYIYPGQVLIVPKAGSKLYITSTGDTLDEIVARFGTDNISLINQNPKIYLQSDQLIVYRDEL